MNDCRDLEMAQWSQSSSRPRRSWAAACRGGRCISWRTSPSENAVRTCIIEDFDFELLIRGEKTPDSYPDPTHFLARL